MMSFAAGFLPKRSEPPEPEQPVSEQPKEDDKNSALREFIHEQMRLRGWNYSEFARAIGTDGSVISRWIRDRRPSPAMTRQMAQRLGVDEQMLMTLVGHISPARGDVTPEQAHLIAKIRQLQLTGERYRILDVLIEDMRKHQP
jgi:transcriptional regulator with XRE-family HTH domain